MGNREDLLAGAKRCLLEKGYAQTTVRDIASAAGVSMAAIGYHYGSREALLTAAMFDALQDWGAEMERLLGSGDYVTEWRQIIGSFTTHRALWVATIEAFLQAERSPELRAQLAAGQWAGLRSYTAGLVDEVTEESIRTVGAIQLALISGVMVQWILDPQHAPRAEEVVAGLRALAAISQQ
ncbi:TetR family transcriptional regulator [Dactylosporangium sp. NPDC005572]|uniref:TetR/AcrR family transcriptional regulator n=1 Tax=Dactylosporangium sp. NPDC005572 TaxID=3156889 RepID=UPI0033BF54CC